MNLKIELEQRLEKVKFLITHISKLMKVAENVYTDHSAGYYEGQITMLIDEKKFLEELIEGVLISETH